jgi:hypothetical protein
LQGTEVFWFGPKGPEDVELDKEWREILMNSWEYPVIRDALKKLLQPNTSLAK